MCTMGSCKVQQSERLPEECKDSSSAGDVKESCMRLGR